MKKLLLTATILAASTVAAVSADLPARNKGAQAPVVTKSWAGFYVGAKLSITTFEDNQKEFDPNTFDNWGSDFKATGVRPGLTAGYDFQWSNIVVGLVADAAWYNLQKKAFQWNAGVPDPTYPQKDTLQYQANLRTRVGYAFGNILPFLSVGGTYTGIERAYQDTNDNSWYKHTANQLGVVFGGGVEYRLSSSLSVKAEYLRSSFGTEKPFTGNISTYANPTYQHSKLSMSEVLLGVNYRF